MQVIVSSAGRFHAVFLAQFLANKNCLRQFFSAGLLASDKSKFLANAYQFNWWLNLADRAYVKLNGDRVVQPSAWYVLRDGFFDAWVRHRVSSQLPADLFVGWANCSLNTLKFLKSQGVKTVIESGSMHIIEQQRILAEEYARWGLAWQPVLAWNRDKMLTEYALTDYIAVPSKHVLTSFIQQGVPASKLICVPYGCDSGRFATLKKQHGRRFQALFIGQVSLQKGIMYLLAAWEQLKLPTSEAELIIVGNVGVDCRQLIAQHFSHLGGVKFCGAVAHAEISKYLATADVFVMPSLQEGLAMVLGEAMASGTAVIATQVSGVAELMVDGREGFIIPPAEPLALAEKLWYCFVNREQCWLMGSLARQAALRWSWQDYGQALFEQYRRICSPALVEQLI